LAPNLTGDLFSARYSVVKRKSIAVPDDAPPCCPARPNGGYNDGYGLQSPQNTPDVFNDSVDMSDFNDLDRDFSFDAMDASDAQQSASHRADEINDQFLFDPWPGVSDLSSSALPSERADHPFDLSPSGRAFSSSSTTKQDHFPKILNSNPGNDIFDLAVENPGPTNSSYGRPRSNTHDASDQNHSLTTRHSYQSSSNAYGLPNSTLESERQSQLPGYGTASPPPTPTTQTTIKLDGAEPSTVAAIMDVLIKSKAKVKFETQ